MDGGKTNAHEHTDPAAQLSRRFSVLGEISTTNCANHDSSPSFSRASFLSPPLLRQRVVFRTRFCRRRVPLPVSAPLPQRSALANSPLSRQLPASPQPNTHAAAAAPSKQRRAKQDSSQNSFSFFEEIRAVSRSSRRRSSSRFKRQRWRGLSPPRAVAARALHRLDSDCGVPRCCVCQLFGGARSTNDHTSRSAAKPNANDLGQHSQPSVSNHGHSHDAALGAQLQQQQIHPLHLHESSGSGVRGSASPPLRIVADSPAAALHAARSPPRAIPPPLQQPLSSHPASSRQAHSSALHSRTVTRAASSSSHTACSPISERKVSSSARVPLSSIVSVLVDEWSRAYTVEALKGDVEAMCLLSSAHFARNGFGCIPHDNERGHDWLARAKKAVVDQAAVEAQRCGAKLCSIVAGAKEAEVEKDVLEKNLTFELEEMDSANESFSDCSARSFSCSREGGDTTGQSLADVCLPSDDGLSSFTPHSFGDSDSSLFNATPMPHPQQPSTPTAHVEHPQRRHSLRMSFSHPDLHAGEWKQEKRWQKWTEGEKTSTSRRTTAAAPTALDACPPDLYEADDSDEESVIPPPAEVALVLASASADPVPSWPRSHSLSAASTDVGSSRPPSEGELSPGSSSGNVSSCAFEHQQVQAQSTEQTAIMRERSISH